MEQVLKDVADERGRQVRIWGNMHDDDNKIANFVQYIHDYAAWARLKAGMNNMTEARERLIQVAAIAVAAVEQIDRHDQTR